ncbi:MAG: LUD domain-containing protein [Saprospiraceae bacterium]|nr:LUD domain-containing protein [Saprospiraceae bacterium]
MSKESILQAIRNNKPEGIKLPDLPISPPKNENLLATFQANAQTSKSRVVLMTSIPDLPQWIQENYANCNQITSTWSEYSGNVRLDQVEDPNALSTLDLAIVESPLGVAENGAVWISDREVPQRILPFITQHLIVVLDRQHIVENMHAAYDSLDLAGIGFGVFIAGPSKTADIEQSLVVGAQGSRSHTVLITG